MATMISEKLEAELAALARKEFPKEAVGLVIAGKLHPLRNIAENPTKAFKLDVLQYLEVLQKHEGDEVYLWHSHPSKSLPWLESRTPSAEDIELAYALDMQILISSFDGLYYKKAVVFPRQYEEELLYFKRPYISGIYDCGTLCCDFYWREFGIELSYLFKKEYLLPENFSSAIKDFLSVNNFKEASLPLQKGDLIIVNFLHYPEAHGLLVMEEGILLNQREFSCLMPWSEVTSQPYKIYRKELL